MKIEKRTDSPILKKGDIWFQINIFLCIVGNQFSVQINNLFDNIDVKYNICDGSESYTTRSAVYQWHYKTNEGNNEQSK